MKKVENILSGRKRVFFGSETGNILQNNINAIYIPFLGVLS